MRMHVRACGHTGGFVLPTFVFFCNALPRGLFLPVPVLDIEEEGDEKDEEPDMPPSQSPPPPEDSDGDGDDDDDDEEADDDAEYSLGFSIKPDFSAASACK